MERTQHFPPEVSNHSQSWQRRVRQPGSGKAVNLGCKLDRPLWCSQPENTLLPEGLGECYRPILSRKTQKIRMVKVKGLINSTAHSRLELVNPDHLRITTPTHLNSTPLIESNPTTAKHVLKLLLCTRHYSTGGKSSGNQSGLCGSDLWHFVSLKTRHASSCLCSSRSPPAFLNVDFTKLEFDWLFALSCGPRTQNTRSAHGKAPQTIVEPRAFTCVVSSMGIILPLPFCQAYLKLLAPLGSAQTSLSPRSSLEFTRFFC